MPVVPGRRQEFRKIHATVTLLQQYAHLTLTQPTARRAGALPVKPVTITFAIAALTFLAPSIQAETVQETVSAQYQATWNWQWHPGFTSDVQSRNSLGSAASRMYTLSLTAHWGMRTWQGGEIYLNPEIASGVPFSPGLVGLGGFTNGEITRAGGSTPKLYRQRLFIRQTWNQGGGSEALQADINQMAKVVDRNRTVLTVGNFSLLDVFDDNSYAKDPRTQFMNWGSWTHAAWDYAADARGFGWGAAMEIIREDWALRFGRMTVPREPNGLSIDTRILRHYGDQIEIERSIELVRGLPGKIRLLAYRNKGVLAGFDDARNALLANPSGDPQTILTVRHGPRIKWGAGLNVEQSLEQGLGFFFRGMRSDGRSETQAFTEVDKSLATGLMAEGQRWGRAGDSAGVALMSNGLSAQRRRYLEAGGISFFIGDGRIDYRPETILETFYSWQVAPGMWITSGYQHIRNPAYNAKRGPVDVIALRVHTRF